MTSTPESQPIDMSSVFTPCTDSTSDALSLSSVRRMMTDSNYALTERGSLRVASGAPLRNGDFERVNAINSAIDAENQNPNAGAGKPGLNKLKAKFGPATPSTGTGDFMDEYWGVPKPETPKVSPEKEDVAVKAPSNKMKSPKVKSSKKSRAARRNAIKKAIASQAKSMPAVSSPWPTQASAIKAKYKAKFEKARQLLREKTSEARNELRAGMNTIVTEVNTSQWWKGVDFKVAAGAISTLLVVLSVLLAVTRSGSEVPIELAESNFEAPVQLPVPVLPPFDIISCTIEQSTILQWRLAGPLVSAGTLAHVSVFVDANLHFQSVASSPIRVVPDDGVDWMEMKIDLLPLTEGLHNFLVVVESAEIDNFARQTSANFVYTAPEPTASVSIQKPEHGAMIALNDFEGLDFTSNNIPENAFEEGYFVDLNLDNEHFLVRFFDGFLELNGLALGKHEITLRIYDGESNPVTDAVKSEFSVV